MATLKELIDRHNELAKDLGKPEATTFRSKKEAETALRDLQAERGAASIDLAPKKEIKPVKPDTVRALLVTMMARRKGASFSELLAEEHKFAQEHGLTPWKPSTLRSGIVWDVNTVLGYGVKANGGGRLHLVFPEGIKAPVFR